MKRIAAFAALVLVAGGAAGALVTLSDRARDERYYRDLLAAGEAALSAGNSFAAIEAFSGAVALRPGAMPGYYRRAEAYRTQRQFEKAAADLRAALRRAPDAPQPRIALGELYDAQGRHGQAAYWYQSAADRLKDKDPALLHRLAAAFYRAGEPAAAIAPLQLALSRNESFPEAQYLLGLAYRDTQQPRAAIAALEQAIRIAPHLTPAREELADLYRVSGRGDDELAQLQALTARDATARRRIALALADARLGNHARALATLEDEVRQAAANSPAALALGRVHLDLAERSRARGAIDLALHYLEKALGGTARRSEGLALYARALHLSGDARQAERILHEAIATSPVYPPAFEYLADVAEELQHPAAARDALLRLEALEGNTASSSRRAARVQRAGLMALRAGDPRGAAAFLQQAVDAGLSGTETLAALARARWAIGDQAGARAAVERALAATPDDIELQRLARAIGRPPA